MLLDVRPPEQFSICHIPVAINAPWKTFDNKADVVTGALHEAQERAGGEAPAVYVVCRRGNDSQRAVARLHEMGFAQAVDVVGGVEGWAKEVDPQFPLY